MTLSVFFITRDEEATLANALESVRPVADQIIVADTGSVDGTVEIARRLGADVYHFPWIDDFAAARNFAVGKATGDWVMSMDADEELLACCHAELRRCLKRKEALGYTLLIQNLVHEENREYFSEMGAVRILRRLEDVRFVGRIHEHLDPPIEQLVQREGKRILPTAIKVRHIGYTLDRAERKLRRAAHLLKLELQDRPGQLYYLIEYGRTLLRLGDSAGHDILSQAAAQVRPIMARPQPPMGLVALLLEYLIKRPADLPAAPISPQEAQDLGRRWFPKSAPLVWLLAERAYQQGQWANAADLLTRLVEMGRTGSYDKSVSFDPRIVGEDAMLNLAVCHVQMGQLQKAERRFQALLASPRLGAQARQNLQVVQGLLGKA